MRISINQSDSLGSILTIGIFTHMSNKRSMNVRICITAQEPNLDGLVEMRFARAPYFLLVDNETGEWEALENELAQGSGGIGPRAVQLLAGKGIRTVITGQLGGNAMAALEAAGIETYAYREGGSARDAWTRFQEGKLSRLV
jgi:predicted Fe-Mo cluster-binding NifX family protein